MKHRFDQPVYMSYYDI